MKQLLKTYCLTTLATGSILLTLLLRTACGENTAVQKPLTLHLEIDKNKVYVHESVQVTVTLTVHGIKVRNIGYPRLPAVNGKQLSFAPFKGQDEAGNNAATYRFSTDFTPEGPGELHLGPAEISLELLQSAGGAAAFFGTVESQPTTAASQAVSVTVLPLPDSGRPASFAGAAGTFKLFLEPLPATTPAEAPLTIKSRIEGSGDLSRADCPVLRAPGVKSYPPRQLRQAGALLCEQLVIPGRAGSLPRLEWSYFNPQQQRYGTLSATLPVVVPFENRSTAMAAVPTQSVQTVSRAAEPKLSNGQAATGAVLLLLAGGAALIWMRRRNFSPVTMTLKKQHTDFSSLLTELDEAHGCGDVGKVYAFLNRILQQKVAIESGLAPQAICGIEAPSMQLVTCAHDQQDMAYLFSRCDLVRYARYAPLPAEMQRDITLLKNMIHSIKQ